MADITDEGCAARLNGLAWLAMAMAIAPHSRGAAAADGDQWTYYGTPLLHPYFML